MPSVLYRRFSCEKYATSFLEEGKIFCRNLLYFRDLERKADTRGDCLEGEVKIRLPDDAKLFIQTPETGEWHHLKTTKAEYNNKIPEPERIFVSCYSIESQSEHSAKFGKYLVTIKDPATLLDRFKLANAAEENLSWGEIEYYAPYDPHALTSKRPIWMRKRDTFVREREFRIAVAILDLERIRTGEFVAQYGHDSVERGMIACAVEFNVGSITDIAALSVD